MKKTLALFVLAIVTVPCFSQIEVKKSAGIETKAAETRVIFQTDGGLVPIYQILSQSAMMGGGSTSGGGYITVSGTGQNVKLICDAPAEIVVQGGSYLFQLTDGILFPGRFKIIPEGGTQVWQVDKGWGKAAGPFIMFGIAGLSMGATMAIMGAAMDMDTFLYVGGGLGVLGGISLPIGIINRPRAKLKEPAS